MKMSKLLSKSFMILLIGVALVSCEKDATDAPPLIDAEDLVISINENSSYNQRNFKISFEQLFDSDMRWGIGFSHEYNGQFKLKSSDLNYSIFGDVGNAYQNFEHFYNDLGIITHSVRTYSNPRFRSFTYDYEYDKLGYIIKLTEKYNDQVMGVVDLEYDDLFRLTFKNYEWIENVQMEDQEKFEYDTEGQLITWIYSNNTNRVSFIYENGLLVEVEQYDLDELYEIGKFYYDEVDRIIKLSFEDDYTDFEYLAGEMNILDYNEGLLVHEGLYGDGFMAKSSMSYVYNDEDLFDYCSQVQINEQGYGNELKIFYGEVNELVEVGRSLITEWHIPSQRPIEQKFLNLNDEVLYINTCTMLEEINGEYSHWNITDVKWYLADGTEIEKSDISEDWVLKLSIIYDPGSRKSNDSFVNTPQTIFSLMRL